MTRCLAVLVTASWEQFWLGRAGPSWLPIRAVSGGKGKTCLQCFPIRLQGLLAVLSHSFARVACRARLACSAFPFVPKRCLQGKTGRLAVLSLFHGSRSEELPLSHACSFLAQSQGACWERSFSYGCRDDSLKTWSQDMCFIELSPQRILFQTVTAARGRGGRKLDFRPFRHRSWRRRSLKKTSFRFRNWFLHTEAPSPEKAVSGS